MEDLFFIGLALGAIALVFGLPVVAWTTAAATRRELRALEERHNALARELRALKASGAASQIATPARAAHVETPAASTAPLAAESSPLDPHATDSAGPAPTPDVEAPVLILTDPERPLPVPDWVPAPDAARRPTEEAIGMTWATRLGGALLLLGVLYFFRYVVQQGWIGPWGRIGAGVVLGLGLIAVAEWLRARTQPLWVHAATGIGVAILLAAAWASHALYDLVPVTAAFIAFALIVVCGGALAIRHKSQPLLITAVLAAIANPVLLSSGEDRPTALFAYLFLVATAATLVSAPRRWLWPTLLSALGTIGLFAGWYFTYFSPDTTYLALATRVPGLAAALVFTALFTAAAIRHGRAVPDAAQPDPQAPVLHIAAAFIGHAFFGLLLIDRPPLFGASMLALAAALGALHAAARTPIRLAWPQAFGFLAMAGLASLALEQAAYLETTDPAVPTRFAPVPLALVAAWAATWLAAALMLHRTRDDRPASIGILGLPAAAFAALLLLGTPDDAITLRTASLLATAAVYGTLALLFHRRAQPAPTGALGLTSLALLALAAPVALDGASVTLAWSALAAVIGVVGVRLAGRPFALAATAMLGLAIAHALTEDFHAPDNARWLFIETFGKEGAFHPRILLGDRGLALFGSGFAAAVLGFTVKRVDVTLSRAIATAGQLLLVGWLITEAWAYIDMAVLAPSASLGEEAFNEAIGATYESFYALSPNRAVVTSLILGLWGGALLAIGFFRREVFLRWLGLAFLAATVAKLLLVDVWELSRLFQTAILIGLGALLLSSGFLYARFGERLRDVIRDDESPKPDKSESA
ncbi:MAG: DUF2339 domain-containing protein [Myxococcota bacterium]